MTSSIDGSASILVSARSRIDEIDTEIAQLVQRRARVIDEIRQAKATFGTAAWDPEREDVVVERAAIAPGPFPRSAMRAVFREIISGCVALQAPAAIAYLGPPGMYSEISARALFGSAATYFEAPTFAAVLAAVVGGNAAFGVMPLETSADGIVPGVVEALIERGLRIRRDYVADVVDCLCSLAPELAAIERVFAHPTVIAQCRRWLRDNVPRADLVIVDSPALAISRAKNDPRAAVLASHRSAEQSNIPIIANRTSDRIDNFVRYVVVGKEDGLTPQANRTLIVIEPAKGDSLTALFEGLSRSKIELVRITSMPGASDWNVRFVLELGGSRADPSLSALLAELVSKCGAVHVLGSFAAYHKPARSIPPPADPLRHGAG
jgi:chorismate mutase / prephenate dehydratase